MRFRTLLTTFAIALCTRVCVAQSLPSDVRANHWAAESVKVALQNKILALQPDKAFHGEAKVTKTEVVNALAATAQLLDTNQWKAHKSKALLPLADNIVEGKEWRTQPITRYALAKILVQSADLFTNSIQRANPTSKDTGKSIKIPPKPKVTLAATHPAYKAVSYLANHKMLYASSPYLNPDDKQTTAAEVSAGLAHLLIGLIDRHTDMMKDADGNTIDRSFHKSP